MDITGASALVRVDVTDTTQVVAASDKAESLGPLRLLVDSAGIRMPPT